MLCTEILVLFSVSFVSGCRNVVVAIRSCIYFDCILKILFALMAIVC